jgi:hypothetical protein
MALQAYLLTRNISIPPGASNSEILAYIALADFTANLYAKLRTFMITQTARDDPERMEEEQFIDIALLLIDAGYTKSQLTKLRDAMAFFQDVYIPHNEAHLRWTDDVHFKRRFNGLIAVANSANASGFTRGPISQDMLSQLTTTALQEGKPIYSMGFLLGFHTLLRHSELQNMKVTHVVFKMGTPSALLLVGGKGRQKPGKKPQLVYVKLGAAAAIIPILIRNRSAAEDLLPGWNQREANALIQRTAKNYRWNPQFRYSFHSLRHGAAMSMKLEGVDPLERLSRGRWAPGSKRVQEHYAAIPTVRFKDGLTELEN